MRFELACAFRYLTPRKQTLATSIISLISVGVIALVVWLVLVFLSITVGIEKRWLGELTSLSAPLQVRPTAAYYNSYYYLIDSFSLATNNQSRSLHEKLAAQTADPFDPSSDPELPATLPAPMRSSSGELRDLAKEAWQTLHQSLAPYRATLLEFEISFGNLHLVDKLSDQTENNFFSQVAYIASFDGNNPHQRHLLKDQNSYELKTHPILGEPILLASSLQSSGIKKGDRGYIEFYAPTAMNSEPMRSAVFVAGFFEPGMVPLGQRILLASRSFVNTVKVEAAHNDPLIGNGFQVWLANLSDVESAKKEVEKSFEKQGLAPYFTVQSAGDYPYSKPIFQQLKSDKMLFTIVALLILTVACSNIISMLILLVNDKKKEIAILQTLGLSRLRIATLFGTTGLLTGLLGSGLGILAAILTLKNIDSLVSFLSLLAGHDAFQEIFYGSHLPNALSGYYLALIISCTLVLSLLAALIPAVKAAKIHPVDMLKQS